MEELIEVLLNLMKREKSLRQRLSTQTKKKHRRKTRARIEENDLTVCYIQNLILNNRTNAIAGSEERRQIINELHAAVDSNADYLHINMDDLRIILDLMKSKNYQ